VTHVCFTVPEIISLVKISLVFKFYLLMRVFPLAAGANIENAAKRFPKPFTSKKRVFQVPTGTPLGLPELSRTPGTVFLGAYST